MWIACFTVLNFLANYPGYPDEKCSACHNLSLKITTHMLYIEFSLFIQHHILQFTWLLPPPLLLFCCCDVIPCRLVEIYERLISCSIHAAWHGTCQTHWQLSPTRSIPTSAIFIQSARNASDGFFPARIVSSFIPLGDNTHSPWIVW